MPTLSPAEILLLLLQYDRPIIIQKTYFICYANAAACELFGYDQDEMLGRDARYLACEHERPRLTEYNRARRLPMPGEDPPPSVYQVEILRKDGSTAKTALGCLLVPPQAGEEPYYIIMFFAGDDPLSPTFSMISDGIARLMARAAPTAVRQEVMLTGVDGKLDGLQREVESAVTCLKETMATIGTELAILKDWRKAVDIRADDAKKRFLTILGLLVSIGLACFGWYFKK